MALRLLYVMDPMARVLVDKDTTFAFQLEGQRRGHEQYHCGAEDLFVDRTVPHATARRLTVERGTPHFRFDEARITPLADYDAVLMRKGSALRHGVRVRGACSASSIRRRRSS
jgi:glutathione synthase